MPQFVTLSWNAHPDAAVVGYKIYYGTSSGVHDQVIDVGSATHGTVSNLAAGSDYFFVVAAYNSAGLESPPTNEARTIHDNASLASLTVSNGVLSPSFSSETTSYSSSVPASTASITLTPIPTDGTATASVNGVTLDYGSSSPSIPLETGTNTVNTVVTARDGITTRVHTIVITRAIDPPGSFILSSQAPVWNGSMPEVQLDWTVSNGATSYDLFRNGVRVLTDASGTSFKDSTGLVSGLTYTYHVVAKNSGGSVSSNLINVGPMPAGPLPALSPFVLSSGTPYWNTATNSPAVALTWSASSNATAYDVYRNSSLYAGNLGAAQLSYLASANLKAGSSYSFYIVARNATGNLRSNTLNLVMPTAPKIAARIISPASGSVLTSSTVTFAWNAGSGVSQMTLWVGTEAGSGSTARNIFSSTVTGRSKQISGLPVDGRPLYVTLRSLINGVWQSNVCVYTSYSGPKVLLLLHDANSSPSGWDSLVTSLQFPNSPIIYNGKTTSTAAPSSQGILCYRVMFGRMDATSSRVGLEGITADSAVLSPTAFLNYYSGDFEQLADLGKEVGDAISCVLSKHPNAQVALLAHGRGGLAARSFLQSSTSNATARKAVMALQTVATPHFGTPLARFYEYLQSHPRSDAAESDNWAVVDTLKEDMTKGTDLRRPTTSDLLPSGIVLNNLNGYLSTLPKIAYAAQVYTGTDLGWLSRGIKEPPVDYNVFQGAAGGALPLKSLSAPAAEYVLGTGKAPSDYKGDGWVPAASQVFPSQGLPPGINPGTYTFTRDVYHSEETAQTSDISWVLSRTVPWWP